MPLVLLVKLSSIADVRAIRNPEGEIEYIGSLEMQQRFGFHHLTEQKEKKVMRAICRHLYTFLRYLGV